MLAAIRPLIAGHQLTRGASKGIQTYGELYAKELPFLFAIYNARPNDTTGAGWWRWKGPIIMMVDAIYRLPQAGGRKTLAAWMQKKNGHPRTGCACGPFFYRLPLSMDLHTCGAKNNIPSIIMVLVLGTTHGRQCVVASQFRFRQRRANVTFRGKTDFKLNVLKHPETWAYESGLDRPIWKWVCMRRMFMFCLSELVGLEWESMERR